MDHARYDKRRYPIVDVREGYGEWVRTYEHTVQDEMDLRLLERLETVDWATARRVLDLACGTGRIGAWIRGRGDGAIDGVDITPEMVEVARRKGVYRTLAIADVTRTGLPAEAYDLCVQSAWLRKKPRWEGRGYLGLPISFAMVWQQKYRPRP